MSDHEIRLRMLADLPPWEWPEGSRDLLLHVLRDPQASESDLLLAAELAGDCTVIDEELVGVLLHLLRSGDKPDELRGTAAIALGPILELVDIDGFEEPDGLPTSHSISEATFHEIQATMRDLYAAATVPKEVKRRILEGSVRAAQDWHADAIRAAYAMDDDPWRLTAVFCMQYVRGFNEQILEALQSDQPEVHYHAVVAAGNWEVDPAWEHVADIVTSDDVDKDLLIAAIHAAVGIRPEEAVPLLADLSDSDDEDIAEAVHEAFAVTGLLSEFDDPDDEDPFD
jgi:HEAT repeat protein